jgi:type I restriction enzyme S subunit
MVKYGAAQKVFNVSHAIDFAFPFPPLDEQRAIADFLDSETARIDELIVSKTKLRELLDQQRRALISQAVSTGLDACQHYRQTPVGQIPEHWSAAQLRRYAWMVTSGSRGWAEFYTDEGELFVRIGNLTRDSMCLDLTDVQRVSPPTGAEGERTRIRVGDVLFSITAYLGSVAVADIEAAGGYINQHIALVRLDTSRLVPEFLAYATLSEAGQSQLGGLGYGGTKIQLGLDDVKSLWIPVPPIAEQRAIVNYLDRQIKTISRLSAEIASAAVRVLEYRSALISAAVTGQIDVRNYRPQEAAAVCQ